MPSKVLILSDVHLCHGDWHGMTSESRMDKMIRDLNAAYEREPYDAVFFLGDYSLDFWKYESGGCYVHHGVSNTQKLVNEYLSRLLCPVRYMIPGNHEQYGHEKWREITGFERQFAVYHDGYLFLMLDTFGGDLDPQTDSDGTYTPVDTAWVQSRMAQYPDAPVILCAHFFDLRRETEAFMELVRTDERILCLFCGHDHIHRVELHPALGRKPILHDGQFSYSITRAAPRCPWGWLEVRLFEEGLVCAYVNPASVMDGQTVPAFEGPMIQLPRSLNAPLPRR